jgi:putative PIN family toxin of toxin-antitoxin system
MLVVLDTNVLVSGLLNEAGSPGRILNLVLDGIIQVAYDDRILGEYEEVLLRPELSLDGNHVSAIVTYLELTGCMVEAEVYPAGGFPDPADLPFVEVFIAAQADALISGNLRHFKPVIDKGLHIYSPAQFLKILGEGES